MDGLFVKNSIFGRVCWNSMFSVISELSVYFTVFLFVRFGGLYSTRV